jgi:predicted metalloprotease
LEKYATGFTEEKFAKLVIDKTKKKQFDSWLYSKVHCIAITETITSIRDSDKQKQVCEDLYLYANSRSSLSAPYYKLE